MASPWKLLKKAPFNVDTMLLLTDGTVMCHELSSPNWHRLTPDTTGSYLNGSWSTLASMADIAAIPKAKGGPKYAPLYFASAVLADGTVFVAGGELNDGIKDADVSVVQIFDPTNSIDGQWTNVDSPIKPASIGDGACCVLPNGEVLLAGNVSSDTALYNPATQKWSTAGANGAKGDDAGEETFTLMPDGTVVSVQCSNIPFFEKYLSASTTGLPPGSKTDRWVSGKVDTWKTPVTLPLVCDKSAPGEIGPAILLPGGTLFAIGATGDTAIYTPDADPSQPGTWTKGPTFKDATSKTLHPMDAGAVLLPSGNVLCVASPAPACSYPGPTYFFEYDPNANALNSVDAAPNSGVSSTDDPGACYHGRFLLLPTGQVLFSNGTTDLSIYTPTGTADNNLRPQITSCPQILSLGQNKLEGRQLNGLSQAVSYGDDATMATNYPLVRLRNVLDGTITYCRTSNHSTMGVATGATINSTEFKVQNSTGDFELEVVANGIASTPVLVSVNYSASIVMRRSSQCDPGLIAGEPRSFDAKVQGGVGPMTFNWTASNMQIVGPASMSTVTVIGPPVGVNGTLALTVTDAFGIKTSASFSGSSLDLPTAAVAVRLCNYLIWSKQFIPPIFINPGDPPPFSAVNLQFLESFATNILGLVQQIRNSTRAP